MARMFKIVSQISVLFLYIKKLTIDWLIIPSLGTGGPYQQQRWSKET